MSKKKKPMSERLREALKSVASEMSLEQIGRDTGINAAMLSRFVRGERSLTLPTADKLADYLKLELRPRK